MPQLDFVRSGYGEKRASKLHSDAKGEDSHENAIFDSYQSGSSSIRRS